VLTRGIARPERFARGRVAVARVRAALRYTFLCVAPLQAVRSKVDSTTNIIKPHVSLNVSKINASVVSYEKVFGTSQKVSPSVSRRER
jgi:hypothetical protein